MRSALASVLTDESFTIPTEEARIYLEIACELVNLYGEPDFQCVEFSSWLSRTLEDIIEKSTKRNSLLNAEKLWSIYHETTDHAQQLKEPLFYQHITDEVFETLVKEK